MRRVLAFLLLTASTAVAAGCSGADAQEAQVLLVQSNAAFAQVRSATFTARLSLTGGPRKLSMTMSGGGYAHGRRAGDFYVLATSDNLGFRDLVLVNRSGRVSMSVDGHPVGEVPLPNPTAENPIQLVDLSEYVKDVDVEHGKLIDGELMTKLTGVIDTRSLTKGAGGRLYTRRRDGARAHLMRKRDEPVRLTRIYTRAGDAGETSLGDGSRVPKTDLRIEAYGTVDELNSLLALALASSELPTEFRPWLERIQNELFDLGADLSVPLEDERERLRVAPEQVEWLEQLCDLVNERLEPLKSFVLPGGGEAAARLHVARTVCRRAERAAVELAETAEINPLALAYLNRLSDLLFILARAASAGNELLWKPGSSS
jgi:cob(I)alamin adenosyltransferase